ncbi:MAG: hypothetical protein WA755_02670 [Candidatus Acidiferrales bacterium]
MPQHSFPMDAACDALSPHCVEESRRVEERQRNRRVTAHVAAPLLEAVLASLLVGCAGLTGGGGSSPPPPQIVVTISPTNVSVLLGDATVFTASASGTTNPSVTWSVNGIAGGNAQFGIISATGQYTAPQILPSAQTVTVTATSEADTNANASASVALVSGISIGIAPSSATVVLGSTESFLANVASAGSPSLVVAWSVNGIAGGNSSVGTIGSTSVDSASYAAPATIPSPPGAIVTVTSVADPSKSASATVTLVCATPNSMSPPSANVALGQMQDFTAALCAPANTPIVWDVNGVVGGNATVGTIVSTSASSAAFTAPEDLPTPNPETLHATAGTQTVSAGVTILSNVTVTVAPPSATVGVNGRATFGAVVTGTTDAGVFWSVNGIPNGNAAIGQVCIAGSNPCVPPVGAISASIDYLAPAVVPSPNPVALAATSNADSSKSGSASVAVLSVTITPPYAFLAPSGASPSQLQFSAQVTGISNAAVIWSVASGVSNAGCGGTACGIITSTGLYAAPQFAPSPNSISVIAASVADPSLSATANVAITSGPTIEQILPSSVMAGVASSFTLAVNGSSFVAGTGSAASVILVNAAPRPTACPTSLQCTTPLQPDDAAVAGMATIQIQNPGSPAPLSNPVPFVVVPFTLTQNIVSLTSAQPESDGNDIVVFEPTTAGTTSSQINVDFAGPITGGTTCNLDSSPIEVALPSGGAANVNICVHGNTLDPSYLYEFTGPASPDISVTASSLEDLFPNLIQLDLTITSSTLPVLRSLFITTPNNDTAVATGLLEVQ